MTITLAACTYPPDRAQIDPLLRAFYAIGQQKLSALGGPTFDVEVAIADFWDHVHSYLPPDGRIWLAQDEGGQVVGLGTLRRMRPDAGEMKRLFVRADFRGQGLARRLVQARIDDARAMGWRYLLADTLRNNTEMQALYLSFGFRFIAAYSESATATIAPELAASLVYMQLDL